MQPFYVGVVGNTEKRQMSLEYCSLDRKEVQEAIKDQEGHKYVFDICAHPAGLVQEFAEWLLSIPIPTEHIAPTISGLFNHMLTLPNTPDKRRLIENILAEVEAYGGEKAYFFLSFTDESGFKGACVAEGRTQADAIRNAWKYGCNPGGEVLCQGPSFASYPPFAEFMKKFGVHKLISWDQLKDEPGMKKLGDLTDEEKEEG